MNESNEKSNLILPAERKAVAPPKENGDHAMERAVSIDPNQMVMVAIEKGYPPEYLNSLLEARDKIIKEMARNAYYNALARFQAKMPSIPRTKTVYNQKDREGKWLPRDKWTVRYHYAPMETIVECVKAPLGKEGLSYSVETDLVFPEAKRDGKEGEYKAWIKAKVITHHKMGHQEQSEFTMPVQQSAGMTYGQSVVSSRTVASRIAFTNALGLITVDPDDDGESASVSAVERIIKQASEFGVTKDQMLRYMGAPKWGDISDTQIEKMDQAIAAMREGATAVQLFGGGDSPTAQLDAESGEPTPADVYRQLDTAETAEQLAEARDLMDVLRSPGHQRIGAQKLKAAEARVSGGRKKKAKRRTKKSPGGAQ